MKFIKAFCIVVTAVTAMTSSAATKFVNHSAAASGDGTSWAKAWSNVSSIKWATLAPGDFVCIAGGTYSGAITPTSSGTSGHAITVERAHASDAHCGSSTAGWSAAFDSQVSVSGIALGGIHYVTIDGMVANGITMKLANSSGSNSAVSAIGPTSNVTLSHIEVSGPCGTTACNQKGDTRSIDLNHWNGSSYDLQDTMTIQNSNLHGSCTILWTAHSTNLVIQHTRFADSADSTPGNPYCHPNVIAEQDSTNATFRFNEVTNWQVEGIMACPNGGCNSSWKIYGNVWHNPMLGSYPRVLEVQGNTNGPYTVYNNTFVDVSYAVFNVANGGSFASGTVEANNIYWNSPIDSQLKGTYDLCNSACAGSSYQVDNNTDLFVGWSTENYQLAIPTVAGKNLSSISTTTDLYNYDFNGVKRGTDGVWDRGAYEFK